MNGMQAEARASSNDKIAPGRRFIAGHTAEKRNGRWQIWDNGSLVFSSHRLKPVATWARDNPKQLEMCPRSLWLPARH